MTFHNSALARLVPDGNYRADDRTRVEAALYCHRFDDIISGAVDPQDVANRPHVRFDGRTLSEIGDQRWAHAQNDALGCVAPLLLSSLRSGALRVRRRRPRRYIQ